MGLDLFGLDDEDHPELLEKFEDEKRGVVWPLPWMLECKMEMVTITTLKRVIDECIASGLVAIDIEATGKDTRVYEGKTVDTIAGIGIAPDDHTGYYIPLNHTEGSEYNIPRSVFEPEILRMFDAGVRVIFHYGFLDQEMLEFNGGKSWGNFDDIKTWEDTALLCYLLNSRRKRIGLKSVTQPDWVFNDDDMSYIKYPCKPHAVRVTQGPKPWKVDLNSDIGLNLPMIELSDLFPKDTKERDFASRFPQGRGTILYGCSDVICTRRLYTRIAPQVLDPSDKRSQRGVYSIEKACMPATRWMLRNQVRIDLDRVFELIRTANKDLLRLLDVMYGEIQGPLGRDVQPGWLKWAKKYFDVENSKESLSEFKTEAEVRFKGEFPDPTGTISKDGKDFPLVYDIFSPPQLGLLMLEMGVPGLKFTEKSGQVATSAEILDALIEEHSEEFPWLKHVGFIRSVVKACGTYLMPMALYTPTSTQRVQVNMKQWGTDTGRFTSPKDTENVKQGFPGLAIQVVPNTYNDPKNPRPESLSRLRECISSGEGWFIVSCDFSGEELRIITNMSREKKWLTAFFQCGDCGKVWEKGDPSSWPPSPPPDRCECGGKTGDLHSVTAEGLYPGSKGNVSPEQWSIYRGNGKVINFALCYGGGGSAIVLTLGNIDKAEGDRLAQRFKETYEDLVRYWQKMHAFGREHGYVLSAFGRKYPVPDLNLPEKFEHPEEKGRKRGRDENSYFRAKAERNAVNGPIQSSGSDICKIAMALTYKLVKKRGWEDKVKLIITSHDELDFEVHGSVLHEFIPAAVDTMTNNTMIRSLKWPVPFTSDVELGTSWAVQWDWNKCARTGKWPDQLKAVLPDEGRGIRPVGEILYGDKALEVKSASPDPSTSTKAKSAPAPASQNQGQTPNVEAQSSVFCYRLKEPLTPDLARNLASAIVASENKGTKILSIQTMDGEDLTAWSVHLNGPVRVSEAEFRQALAERGL